MIHFELQFEPTDVEKFSIFNTDLEFSLDELDEKDKQIYLDVLGLIGDARIAIKGISDDDHVIIFRKARFEVNSDMSISNKYPVDSVDYSAYSETSKNQLDLFVGMINKLKA